MITTDMDAENDDQEVRPCGGTDGDQQYADGGFGERSKRHQSRIERWPWHFRKVGQVYCDWLRLA